MSEPTKDTFKEEIMKIIDTEQQIGKIANALAENDKKIYQEAFMEGYRVKEAETEPIVIINRTLSNCKLSNCELSYCKISNCTFQSEDGITSLKIQYEELTETESKIIQVLDGTKNILLYKNKKYGDSALHPIQVFSKSDASSSIDIRLDDKLSRMINASDLNEEEKITFINLFRRVFDSDSKNDMSDMIGYEVLKCAIKNWLDFSEFMD